MRKDKGNTDMLPPFFGGIVLLLLGGFLAWTAVSIASSPTELMLQMPAALPPFLWPVVATICPVALLWPFGVALMLPQLSTWFPALRPLTLFVFRIKKDDSDNNK